MAITFLHTPKEVDFAGNPVSIQIHGTGYIKSPGSKTLLALQILGLGPQEGDSLSFTVLSKTYSFTFAGVPDDTGTQLQANNDMTTPQYLEALKVSVYSIFLFQEYYKITYSAAAGIIYFEALQSGIEYSFLDIQINSSGIALHQSIPGTDFEVTPEYRFLTSIYEIINANQEKLMSLVHDPDLQANSIVNVGEKVDWKKWTAPLPSLDYSTTQQFDLTKRIVCKCAELIDGTIQRIYDSPEIKLLPGKIQFHLWPAHAIAQEIINSRCFYSVKAAFQNTWSEAKEFLNFLVPVVDHSIAIAVSVTYSDGTSANKIVETIEAVPKYTLLTIPAGISQLGLNTWNPTKQIFSYEIRLYSSSATQQNILLTKPATFQLIKRKPWFRQLILANNFGVWETINITGKAKRIITPTKEITKKVTQYNYNPLSPEKRSMVTTSEDYLELNTGVMLNTSADSLKHLVESNNMFLISGEGYIPITIREGSFEIQDESEDLINIKLQIEGIDGSSGLISHFGPGSYSDDYSNSYD